MKRIACCVLGAMLLCAGLGQAIAEEMAGTMPPPKVLMVFREFLKPGKGGSLHEKAESAFVQAFARAKWPTHYLTVTSVTGKPRALFLVGFDSFDAWEKDTKAQEKNAALGAALDRAAIADGDLLSGVDGGALVFNEEQSLRASVDIAHMRYFEISLFRLRSGHRKEWDDLVKLVKDAYDKIPDVHWATYEEVYGQEDTTFVVFTPMKSASEIDQGMENDKKFVAAMGEDGMKKLAELESSAIEFRQSNLFTFSPKMSYPRDEWIKADPDFWKPKAAAPAKTPAKAEEKPAQ
jgi:hypothetical protein